MIQMDRVVRARPTIRMDQVVQPVRARRMGQVPPMVPTVPVRRMDRLPQMVPVRQMDLAVQADQERQPRIQHLPSPRRLGDPGTIQIVDRGSILLRVPRY
jgi:hypothetical protein